MLSKKPGESVSLEKSSGITASGLMLCLAVAPSFPEIPGCESKVLVPPTRGDDVSWAAAAAVERASALSTQYNVRRFENLLSRMELIPLPSRIAVLVIPVEHRPAYIVQHSAYDGRPSTSQGLDKRNRQRPRCTL